MMNNSGISRSPSLLKPDQALIERMLRVESDERYKYLVQSGTIHYVEADTLTVYVELA